jgi:hypothetical protein
MMPHFECLKIGTTEAQRHREEKKKEEGEARQAARKKGPWYA